MENHLLNAMDNFFDDFVLAKYGSDLFKIYPQEVLQIYVGELRRSAKQAHSRNTYYQWVQTLKHMKTIKGGCIKTVRP